MRQQEKDQKEKKLIPHAAFAVVVVDGSGISHFASRITITITITMHDVDG